MKVCIHISKCLQQIDIHRDLISILANELPQDIEVVSKLENTDVLLIFGAWQIKDSRLARKALKMGIPYLIIPLGHISKWNIEHYLLKRILQTKIYQNTMIKKASAVLTLAKMENTYLKKLKWNTQIFEIPNSLFTRLTTNKDMSEQVYAICRQTLYSYQSKVEEETHKITDDSIIFHILLIKKRMSHQNIPLSMFQQLHHLLHDTEYNDDELEEKIRKLKLTGFAASLFAVLIQQTGLTEGFIPFPQKRDKLSKTIKKYIK